MLGLTYIGYISYLRQVISHCLVRIIFVPKRKTDPLVQDHPANISEHTIDDDDSDDDTNFNIKRTLPMLVPGGGHFDVFGTGYVPLDRV